MAECFKIDTTTLSAGKYVIRPIHENFYLEHTEGSFNIICARLLGLSYAQYLRFCRDMCGAELYGKNELYPIPVFKMDNRLTQLVTVLNKLANLVLWERSHPDWKAHATTVQKYKEARDILLNHGEKNHDTATAD